jgi:phage I-like protein
MWKTATASLAGIDKSKAARIQLFPAGWFGAADGSGQRWFLDAALAQKLIDDAAARTNDYLFDYEHQSLNAPDASGPVRAAGWFKSLSWVEGEGLFADVNWTKSAAALIQSDEYRYVSPTFLYDEQGNVRKLVNAALTNMPVLDGMRRVAASLMFFNNGETPMNENLRLALCAIMGVDTKADESTILAAVEALRQGELKAANCSSIGALIESQKALLQQKDQSIQDGQTQIATLSAAAQGKGNVDLSQYTPNRVVDEMRDQLAALSSQVQNDKVETLLTAALSDGRVMAGADADHLRELGKSNFDLMEKMVGARKPIAALSQLQTSGMDLNEKGQPVPDAGAMAVCSQFADFGGLNEKEFSEAFAKEMGYAAD